MNWIQLLLRGSADHALSICLKRSCAIVALVIIAIEVTNAQIPSVLRRQGFNGPVRTVHREFRQYSWENSRWDPSGDPILDVIRYDRNGRCLTSHIDPGSGWRPYGVPLPPATGAPSRRYELVRKRNGSIGWKTVWHFDDKGRLGRFEAFALYEHGPTLSKWEQYSYDSQGRVEAMTYWADWGWSPGQTEPYPPVRLKYWFDSAGRIGGWTEVDNPKRRTSLTYDDQGRVVKLVDENEDGYITTETRAEYDQHGNWTVQTTTTSWRTDDEDEPQSQSVLRRSITYGRASNKHRRRG